MLLKDQHTLGKCFFAFNFQNNVISLSGDKRVKFSQKVLNFLIMTCSKFEINDRFLKANLSLSRTRAKLCRLIASLSVILPKFNLTKFTLEYLKSGFKRKKERFKHRRKKFLHYSSLLLEYGCNSF